MVAIFDYLARAYLAPWMAVHITDQSKTREYKQELPGPHIQHTYLRHLLKGAEKHMPS